MSDPSGRLQAMEPVARMDVDGMGMGKRPATYEDLEELPPNMVGEIIAGELYASPRPAMPHTPGTTALGSGRVVGPFHRGEVAPAAGILFDDPSCTWEDDVLVPDLAGWRRERLPEAPRGAALTLAPDWACEILSPSTEARDRASKLPAYARERVSSTCGSSIRTSAPWRSSAWRARTTRCSPRTRVTPGSVSSPSMPSSSS